MAKRGRPPVLDEGKQREILAILSVGCSRRTAAHYVSCATSTIQNTAERDERFAARLDRAENQAVVTHMTNINKAAKKAQYWRAAAWALERLKPEEYASPHPDLLTAEQMLRLMEFLSQIIVDEVPVGEYRKNILKRLDELNKMLSAVAPSTPAANAEETQSNNGPETASS